MRDAADISWIVRGVEYRDIKRCTVQRAIDQIADEVYVELADTWAETGALALPFLEGDPFELRIDGELWVTGFINSRPSTYSKDGHNIGAYCLSKPGQLSTSCHEGPPRTWVDVPLDQIVRDVCLPYGIGVNVFTDVGANFTRFAASIGEQAFDVIRRACTKRGVWATSNVDGDLELIEAGQDMMLTPIIGHGVPGQPTNILTASSDASYSDTYSRIIVVGQSSGSTDWTGDQMSHGFAVAKCPWVTEHRPLVIHESGESGHEKLQRRADWEMRTRTGKSRRLNYTMQGYLAELENPPAPWRPNTRVQVVDGKYDIDEQFLIERVSNEFSPGGTTVSIDLVAPATYELLAPAPRSKTAPRDRKGKYLPYG
jgi:prophage tail gpP-like protein